MSKRKFKVDDIVYTWSNARYGESYITRCIVQEVCGTTLNLYAIEENRAFYREMYDCMSFEELKDNFERMVYDHEHFDK